MAGIPYIKFYASDWRAGTTNTLTLDEEGLYIRACVYMWATGEPVPGNDRLAAKALCVQPLRYEKLMAGLIAKGKMIRGQGSVFNERVMEDLAAYRAEQAQNSARTQKGWDRRRATLTQNVELAEAVAAIKEPTPQHTPPRTPRHTPPHTGGVTAPVADGKPNDYNDRFLQEQCQPETRSQKPESKSPKPPEGASDGWAYSEYGVCYDGKSRVALVNGTHAEWLERFGDADRLNVALIQAGVSLQPRSGTPIASQVFRHLARQAADKLDRDKRSQNAVNAKDQPAKPFKVSRFGLGGPRR
jgi:uncharacterized protein YdaU (DUF1376 family)